MVWSSQENSHYLPPVAQPNLDYLAPENSLSNGSLSSSSDIFSLGMLIYAIYNDGKPIFTYNNDWNYFIKKISEVIINFLYVTILITFELHLKLTFLLNKLKFFQLKNIQNNTFNNIPQGLQNMVKTMLVTDPGIRPDPHTFTKV